MGLTGPNAKVLTTLPVSPIVGTKRPLSGGREQSMQREVGGPIPVQVRGTWLQCPTISGLGSTLLPKGPQLPCHALDHPGPTFSFRTYIPGKVGDLILAKASLPQDCPSLLVHLSGQFGVRGRKGTLLHLGTIYYLPFFSPMKVYMGVFANYSVTHYNSIHLNQL